MGLDSGSEEQVSSTSLAWEDSLKAALKGTNLRGRTPICGFLRVPAVFCGCLRQSVVFCENLRFPDALFSSKGENQRKSARICENPRLGSVCPLRFVLLSAAQSLTGLAG